MHTADGPSQGRTHGGEVRPPHLGRTSVGECPRELSVLTLLIVAQTPAEGKGRSNVRNTLSPLPLLNCAISFPKLPSQPCLPFFQPSLSLPVGDQPIATAGLGGLQSTLAAQAADVGDTDPSAFCQLFWGNHRASSLMFCSQNQHTTSFALCQAFFGHTGGKRYECTSIRYIRT